MDYIPLAEIHTVEFEICEKKIEVILSFSLYLSLSPSVSVFGTHYFGGRSL